MADDARSPRLRPDLLPGASCPTGWSEQLSHLHVVQHGIDVNGNGEYYVEGAGESTFAKNLGVPGVPEEATDPASCGVVTGAMAPRSRRVEWRREAADTQPDRVDLPLAGVGAVLLVGSALALWSGRRRSVARD